MIPRPNKTLADYFAIAISPALIMLLVGSLCFFLVEVFYRGEAIDNVRWVLFWFVIATVLVSRIGIEQGTGHAAAYGLALAAATWLYLTRIHPAYLLGAVLLGIVWWCAHKLTWDCTLIDEDEDASDSGLLQKVWRKKPQEKKDVSAIPKKPGLPKISSKQKSVVHPPGTWLIYFSLAALPLFGIGQTLLSAGDLAARHAGFEYLFVYLSAVLGLFLTTSFLGLRRYLRQRYLPMPASIALGWLKFGAGVGFLILILALLVPRPGAGYAWATLRYHLDYQLRQASEYAMKFSPHGSGQSNSQQPSNTSQKPGSQSQNANQQPNAQKKTPEQSGQDQSGQNHGSPSPKPSSALTGAASHLYQLLKWLLLLAAAALIGWWLFRRHEVLLKMAREFWAALLQFFRDLFGFRFKGPATVVENPQFKPQAFASYQNPFATGEAATWTPHQLILYSYEALQSWAAEQGIKPKPEQTAREVCGHLGENFPEIAAELHHLAYVYGHAAYGTSIPKNYNPEVLKQLWDYISIPRATAPPSKLETASALI
jgi:hypothetical protein